MRTRHYFFAAFILMTSGCSTVSQNVESAQEAQSALESIAGNMAGKELTSDDLGKLAEDLKHDEEVQSAVGMVTESLSGNPVLIKYCPSTGKRYDARLTYADDCPEKLEYLEN